MWQVFTRILFMVGVATDLKAENKKLVLKVLEFEQVELAGRTFAIDELKNKKVRVELEKILIRQYQNLGYELLNLRVDKRP